MDFFLLRYSYLYKPFMIFSFHFIFESQANLIVDWFWWDRTTLLIRFCHPQFLPINYQVCLKRVVEIKVVLVINGNGLLIFGVLGMKAISAIMVFDFIPTWIFQILSMNFDIDFFQFKVWLFLESHDEFLILNFHD